MIFCCGCEKEVDARLTDGSEIYPHRGDLATLPFWKCDECGNYVGCCYKTNTPTKPLGNIPTPEMRNARKHIHAILDPIWKSGKVQRGTLYGMISDKLGYQYHTAELRTIDEARRVWKIIRSIAREHNVHIR